MSEGTNDLRCTFCGYELWINEDEAGVRQIECNRPSGGGCFASWSENGTYLGGGKAHE